MFGKIKYLLRRLKAQGKFPILVKLLMKANAQYKSIKQRVHKNEAIDALATRQFGGSPQEWIDFIWDAANGFFRPIQQRQEITKLVQTVSARNPKTVLEIGTANGGSLFLFCRAAAENAIIVSIDLPGGINGGGFPNWKTSLYKDFADTSQQIHLLRLDSHKQSTRDQVAQLTPTRTFDVIMIDADHSYEGVKRDFELYKTLVAKGGIVVLHDVIMNRFDPSIQVNVFWGEVKQTHTTEEIIFDPQQGNMGIGIVFC